MSLKQMLAILLARKWVVIGVFIAVVAITVIVSFALPRQYTASGSVVIDVKSPDPIAGMVLPGLMSPAYMSTQADIIQSERVARKVIEKLHLDSNAIMQEQWKSSSEDGSDFQSWLTDALIRNLDVRPSRESNVIEVSYTSPDGRFSSIMVNAFIEAYVETNLELRVEPAKQYRILFDAQSKALREKLENAQTKLSEYQKTNGLIATDERLDIENARLAELSSQLVAMQAVSAESISRDARMNSSSPEVLANPVVGALKADWSRQEAKLKELTSRYGDAHPQVVELRANVKELEAKLNSEVSNVGRSLGINKNVNVAREGQVRAALDAQRTKVLKLKEQRDAAALLLQDVVSAQRALENNEGRLYQTNLETQSTQTNVSLLKRASPPSKHSFPKIPLNIIVSVLLGAMLAAGLALLIEIADRKLRTPEDIEALGQSFIATIPKVDLNRPYAETAVSPGFLKGRGLLELAGPSS